MTPPESVPDYIDPVTGMIFVFVRGGAFEMGDTLGDGFPDERPTFQVTVSDFWLAKHPVTQGQWRTVMDGNPSMFRKGEDYPLEMVSHDLALAFLQRLNALTDGKQRLPTEAEWEYAAREGGRALKWSGTSNLEELGEYAWFDQNSRGRTHPVGLKKANALGLHDLSGLTHEWVLDGYHPGTYAVAAQGGPYVNPVFQADTGFISFRGGSWKRHAEGLRCTRRMGGQPDQGYGTYGLRLARTT